MSQVILPTETSDLIVMGAPDVVAFADVLAKQEAFEFTVSETTSPVINDSGT